MKLSTWLRAAALTQLTMVGVVTLGTIVPAAISPLPAGALLPAVGAMALNVLIIAVLWLPVLRSADGVAQAEDGSANAEQLASALWLLGSHFKRIVLLALSAPLLMVVVWSVFAIVEALGYELVWLV